MENGVFKPFKGNSKPIVDGRQQCARCKEWKDLNEFYRHKKTKSGRNSHCKLCENKRNVAFRETSRFKEWNAEYTQSEHCKLIRHRLHRKHDLRKKWKMTEAEYDHKLQEQGGVCAICGGQEIKKGWHMSIDHDHATGKIRDILCSRCNVILGQARDSVPFLEKCIEYLKKHESKEWV
jgi:hypothetical protein